MKHSGFGPWRVEFPLLKPVQYFFFLFFQALYHTVQVQIKRAGAEVGAGFCACIIPSYAFAEERAGCTMPALIL